MKLAQQQIEEAVLILKSEERKTIKFVLSTSQLPGYVKYFAKLPKIICWQWVMLLPKVYCGNHYCPSSKHTAQVASSVTSLSLNSLKCEHNKWANFAFPWKNCYWFFITKLLLMPKVDRLRFLKFWLSSCLLLGLSAHLHSVLVGLLHRTFIYKCVERRFREGCAWGLCVITWRIVVNSLVRLWSVDSRPQNNRAGVGDRQRTHSRHISGVGLTRLLEWLASECLSSLAI